MQMLTSTKMMLFFCVGGGFALALVPHLIWGLAWLVCRAFGCGLPYKYFGVAALALVFIFWGVMAYGYFVGRWQLHTEELEYKHADIPKSFDGFKLVQISDLHLSTFDDSPEQLERIVAAVNACEADLICFTGDLVTVGREEALPYAELLKSLKAKHGVVSVLGNHDFLIYSFADIAERKRSFEDMLDFQRDSLGWRLLRNENLRIVAEDGSSISIIGVDNASCTKQGFKSVYFADLTRAVQGSDGFRILLSHDPSLWRAEVLGHTDIPLTLSGHTHCAQVKVLGWTPATVSFDETDGLYEESGQSLYINTGLGCTAPFRIGVGPEITLITLRSVR